MIKHQDPTDQNAAQKPKGAWGLRRKSARGSNRFGTPRRLRWVSPAIALLFLSLFCHRSSAQTYSIDWHEVSGGGGSSGGGPYSLNGTIGHPEAGALVSGGAYSLAGGFWALYAVQTTGVPSLHVFLSSTNTAVVWWPSPSAGWTLQQNSSLVATNWISATTPIQDDGRTRSIVIPAPAANRFYRLANP